VKRLLLAAVFALGLHALVLGAKVKWSREASLFPDSPPIRLSLSYQTPQPREVLPPPPIEPHAKAPDPPAAEKVKDPEPVPEKREPPQKKRPPQKPEEQKTVREIIDTAQPVEAGVLADENTETLSGPEKPAAIPAAPTKPMTSDTTHALSIPHRSGHEPAAAPSRQALPLYLKNPPPEYPPAARRRGYAGTVMMEVFVDREGKVRDLRLVQSSGHAMLDRAAMRAVKGWMFEPARQGEEKVDMWVKVPLTFRLKDQDRN
jgi:periplasmic protein TonB